MEGRKENDHDITELDNVKVKIRENNDVPDSSKTDEADVHLSTDLISQKIAAGVPIDKGWAWMCVLGGLIVHILLAGTIRSCGIIFVEVSLLFNRNNKDTAWIVTFILVFLLALSPISNATAERFTTRVVIFIGGIIVAVGNFISVFATSLEYIYISYGILLGIGFALIHPPCLVFVAQHFHHYRTLAIGLTLAGASIGSLVMPPLTQGLVDHYGLRGAFMMLSALQLNTCVAASLMRPHCYYEKSITQTEKGPLLNDDRKDLQVMVETEAPYQIDSTPLQIPVINILKDNDEMMTQSLDQLNENMEPVTISQNTQNLRKATSERQLRRHQETKDSPRRYLGKPGSLSGSRFAMHASFGDLAFVKQEKHDSGEKEKSCDECPPEKRSCIQRLRHSVVHSLNWTLWKSPVFLFYATSIGLVTEGLPMCFMMLPSHARDLELGSNIGPMVIFWMGLPDLISRVSIGLFADRLKKPIFRVMLYLFFTWFEGGCWMALPYLSRYGFSGLLIFGQGVGFSGGGLLCLMPSIFADAVGVKNLSSAIGFSMLIEAAVFLAVPVILGYLRDLTGTWTMSIYVAGGIIFVGGFSAFIPSATNRLCMLKDKLNGTKISEPINQVENVHNAEEDNTTQD